jgi:hypothetical protein
MARLRTARFDPKTGVDQFEPDRGRQLLDLFPVEPEDIVVVEELEGERICWTLLSMQTGELIPVSQRHREFNDKISKEKLPEGYFALCKISVSGDTGFESLTESVYREGDDNPQYSITRPRYTKVPTEPLWQRYCNYQTERYEFRQAYIDHLQAFYAANLSTKSGMLATIFRKQWRVNSEQGLESPEFFLSNDQFNAYDRDPDFRVALEAVVRAESRVLKFNPDQTYLKILDHYLDAAG